MRILHTCCYFGPQDAVTENDDAFKFTYTYTPLPVNENEHEDIEWINYNCDTLTSDKIVANTFDETGAFLKSFENQMDDLLLSQKEANKVYELCEKLIDCIQHLNSILITNSNKMNALQVCNIIAIIPTGSSFKS